jgi:hypothetical protein
MSEEDRRIKAEEKGDSPKKVTRREALKRIAQAAGGAGLFGAFPPWDTRRFDSGSDDIILQRQLYAAYYSARYSSSSYNSYRYYSSYNSAYYSASSYTSSSSYSSVYNSGKSPFATCFIDTLEKIK